MSIGPITRRDPALVHEAATIALVDVALARASHCVSFTRDEAAQLLLEIRASVRDIASVQQSHRS